MSNMKSIFNSNENCLKEGVKIKSQVKGLLCIKDLSKERFVWLTNPNSSVLFSFYEYLII